jgi:hypothetical protein
MQAARASPAIQNPTPAAAPLPAEPSAAPSNPETPSTTHSDPPSERDGTPDFFGLARAGRRTSLRAAEAAKEVGEGEEGAQLGAEGVHQATLGDGVEDQPALGGDYGDSSDGDDGADVGWHDSSPSGDGMGILVTYSNNPYVFNVLANQVK